MIQKELVKLSKEFIDKFGELSLIKIDCEDTEYNQIIEEIQGVSMFTPQKMVVLKSPSKNKQLSEEIESLVENTPQSTQLIVVEPVIDKRSKVYKTLKARTDYKEFSELNGFLLVDWLAQTAKSHGANITKNNAQHLIERVGTNQNLLENEIEKLSDYNQEISKDSIDLLTEATPDGTVFNLLDAALKGQTKKAFEIYNQQRAQKVDPSKILSMLAWQLHILAIIKTAGDRSDSDIAKEAKINPFVVQKSRQNTKDIDITRLKKLINELAEIDYKIKNSKINADQAVQNYLLALNR